MAAVDWQRTATSNAYLPNRPSMIHQLPLPDRLQSFRRITSCSISLSSARLLPAQFHGGAFIGEHSSWNRNPPSGYKVVFVPFANGKPSGDPIDVLTGFLGDNGDAWGRPVGVAIDRSGALLVADDVGNAVWRVTPKQKTSSR
jgi:glucose/arabinose dehydrogenase